MIVNNKEVFHIQRYKRNYDELSPLNIGEKFIAGEQINQMANYHESFSIYYLEENLYVNNVAEEMIRYLKTGEKANNYSKFNYDPLDLIINLKDSLNDSLRYIRESIFEQIRLEHYKDLPSRQKCLWVVDNIDDLKFWYNQLGNSGRIYKINLNGNIHIGHEKYLKNTTKSLNWIREQAHFYWQGADSDKAGKEIIFAGEFEVIEELDVDVLKY